MVIAIITILAAMLLPALSKAKAQAKRIQCVNNLRRMGVALNMRVQDYKAYPYYQGPNPDAAVTMGLGVNALVAWEDSLQPYYKLWWFTNTSCLCPAFDITLYGGDPLSAGPGYGRGMPVTYAYNRFGTDEGGGRAGSTTFLGLGNISTSPGTLDGSLHSLWLPEISESQVKAPSEMFAFTDSRILKYAGAHYEGWDFMTWGNYPEVTTARHGHGYNVACCDGHVVLVKRMDWLDKRKSSQNWNNDHQPHPETW